MVLSVSMSTGLAVDNKTRTGDSPVHHRSILQFNGYSFVVQFHQKPVGYKEWLECI